ncbi:MAG: hypothetical protein ACI91R_000215 [Vicingaceae bacterium]|jgi:hypothetical protein
MVIGGLLLTLQSLIYSQKLQLKTLSSFGACTGTGAFSNARQFTGDASKGVGRITSIYNEAKYNANVTTNFARIDLLRVYIHPSNIFVTHKPLQTFSNFWI